MRLSNYFYTACTGMLISGSALAQNTTNIPANTIANSASTDQSIEEIIILHPLLERGTSQSLTTFSGEELAEILEGSIGETVAREPGVRSSSFGTAVGRPVIHGLGGARVKTTQDRIDSLDVAVTSPDHAVSVEPFIASRVSILKGASTLLYGSGAIGGVVDVETGRVPTQIPDNAIGGKAEVRVADNADAHTGAFRLDGKFSDSVAWHVDGFTREADEYEIPETDGVSLNPDGDLLGSFLESDGGAIGISTLGEWGHVGLSVSRIEGFYGLLGGEEEEEEGEEGEEGEEEAPLIVFEEGFETATIDLEQTRFDLDGRINQPFAGVKQIDFRLGVNDYEHLEIEASGEAGTVFENDAWEARASLTHESIAGFTGTFGLQLGDREFSAIGAEAFIAPTDTQSIAAFWVGERQFQGFDLEAGIRFENVDHEPENSEVPDIDFSTVSASVGFVVPVKEATRVSALFDYSSRAPTIEELFSDGPHLATQTFEIGDINLDEESAASISLSVNHESENFAVNATLYHNEFDGFIYQENIGLIEDGLPVLVYEQDDASFTGLDFEIVAHLFKINNSDLDLGLTYDRVSARLDSSANVENRNLPRIPSDRFGAYLAWKGQGWNAKLNYSRVSTQDQTAEFEAVTEGFDDVSLRIGRELKVADSQLTVYFQGRNLTDDVQRNHTSFVSQIAPAPGRRLELGVQFTF